ncbi:hypothetical protein [Candidatus Protofrankia californiensis]|nr:hypothetical protein [Candidatus Protofrankia californiensis]
MDAGGAEGAVGSDADVNVMAGSFPQRSNVVVGGDTLVYRE